jgi:hypothetical protein
MRLPNDPANPAESIDRMRQEREAIERAEQWAKADPFYEGKPITKRERALMHLALRAFTHPTMTDIALIKLETMS